jgi:hypothetical protein
MEGGGGREEESEGFWVLPLLLVSMCMWMACQMWMVSSVRECTVAFRMFLEGMGNVALLT